MKYIIWIGILLGTSEAFFFGSKNKQGTQEDMLKQIVPNSASLHVAPTSKSSSYYKPSSTESTYKGSVSSHGRSMSSYSSPWSSNSYWPSSPSTYGSTWKSSYRPAYTSGWSSYYSTPPKPSYGKQPTKVAIPKELGALLSAKLSIVGAIIGVINAINGGLIAMKGKIFKAKGEILSTKGAAIEDIGNAVKNAGKAMKSGMSNIGKGGKEYELFVSFLTQTQTLLSTLFEMAKSFGVFGNTVKQKWKRTEDMLASVIYATSSLPPNKTDWNDLINTFFNNQTNKPSNSFKHREQAGFNWDDDTLQKINVPDFNHNDIEKLVKFIPFPDWDYTGTKQHNVYENSISDDNLNLKDVAKISPNSDDAKFSTLLTSLHNLRDTIEAKDSFKESVEPELNKVSIDETSVKTEIPSILSLIESIKDLELNAKSNE